MATNGQGCAAWIVVVVTLAKILLSLNIWPTINQIVLNNLKYYRTVKTNGNMFLNNIRCNFDRTFQSCRCVCHTTLKTFCQIDSCPVNAKGKLIPWSAIQSISFSHLFQSHHTKESIECYMNFVREKMLEST